MSIVILGFAHAAGPITLACFFFWFSCIYLLKFVLVRWCLGVVSMSPVLQFTVILGADVVSVGARSMSSGMLVTSALVPWALGITRRVTLGTRLGCRIV